MQIDILYFDGCPGHRPTVELVEHVVSRLDLEATIRQVEVRDAAEAQRLRFLGSPTVRVEGQDIDPGARGRGDFSLSCRMYGSLGFPPRSLVEQALIECRAVRSPQGRSPE